MRKSLTSDFNGSKIKQVDDWDIICEPKTGVKIKSITVYACHYITAINVTYEEDDLNVYNAIHTGDNKYLSDTPELEKVTLNLANDEYVDFISYVVCKKKKYIRSIKIGTTHGHLLILEGQIELNSSTTNSNLANTTESF